MLTRDSAGFAAKGAWFEIKKECTCKSKRPNTNTPLEEQIPWGSCLSENGEYLMISESGRCDNEVGEFKRKGYDIYKDPITDNGSKKSLKGLVQVNYDDNMEIVCLTECTFEQEGKGLLQVIYEDGEFFNQTTLQEIRERVNKN